MDKEFWNERYKAHDTVYGMEPNQFFSQQLLKFKPGRLLLPAEGEGRNALFAARNGWKVTAFDYSQAAIDKARRAALGHHVAIDYSVQDIEDVVLPLEEYDAIGLIYVHLEPAIRKPFFQQCIHALKPGGVLIMEGFSKGQLQNSSGGPKDIEQLYSAETLLSDLAELESQECREEEVILDEGRFHSGKANVVRLVALKQGLVQNV